MHEQELPHIKHELEKIRDHLYDEKYHIALYKLGYIACHIDNLIAESENENG
jgi:hypothetical protein